MTRTGRTLGELGAGLSAGSLQAFLLWLPQDSATWRDEHQDRADEAEWAGSSYTQQLLAGISDTLSMLAWEFSQVNSKHDLRRYIPQPIPRPGVVDDRHVSYGRDPIPVAEFDSWWQGGGDDGKQ